MNKKIIEELSSQAWQFANLHTSDGDGLHGKMYAEKFAELIIQECMNAVLDPKDAMFMSMNEEYAARASRNAIAKHFGVKQ